MAAKRTKRAKTTKRQAEQPKPRGIVPRAKGPAVRRISVYLDPALYRQARVHVAEQDITLSEWLAALIERELG